MTKLPAQVHDAMDRPDGGTYLRTPYDEEYLDEFREAIPVEHRSWDRDDREWWVSGRYARRAIRVASDYFNIEYCD